LRFPYKGTSFPQDQQSCDQMFTIRVNPIVGVSRGGGPAGRCQSRTRVLFCRDAAQRAVNILGLDLGYTEDERGESIGKVRPEFEAN
jgi:hypothetical protein